MSLGQPFVFALIVIVAIAAAVALPMPAERGNADGRSAWAVFFGVFAAGVALLLGIVLIAMMRSLS